MPVVDPVKGVSRIASVADLSEKSKRKAVEILTQAKDTGLVAGKDPMGNCSSFIIFSMYQYR